MASLKKKKKRKPEKSAKLTRVRNTRATRPGLFHCLSNPPPSVGFGGRGGRACISSVHMNSSCAGSIRIHISGRVHTSRRGNEILGRVVGWRWCRGRAGW